MSVTDGKVHYGQWCATFDHGDPDNSGQCIYCGKILDGTDDEYVRQDDDDPGDRVTGKRRER